MGAKCISGHVQCYAGDGSPMTAEIWPVAIAQSSVMVMTAQILLNMLETVASISQFDLMVSTCSINAPLSTFFAISPA